jgi:hypothetical protein
MQFQPRSGRGPISNVGYRGAKGLIVLTFEFVSHDLIRTWHERRSRNARLVSRARWAEAWMLGQQGSLPCPAKAYSAVDAMVTGDP